ncbi:MAG: hypothetical protein ACYDCQ_20120 [Dehalococcoidia bacterium]
MGDRAALLPLLAGSLLLLLLQAESARPAPATPPARSTARPDCCCPDTLDQ